MSHFITGLKDVGLKDVSLKYVMVPRNCTSYRDCIQKSKAQDKAKLFY